MLYKTTNKLFQGTYHYKIVLICPGSSLFRHGDMAHTLELLQGYTPMTFKYGFKTQPDLDYAFSLQAALSNMQDVSIRVESPWVSVYTNELANVNTLTSLDENRVKYVSVPPNLKYLAQDTIIMPKVPFEFRVTMGKTTQNHSAFVQWAEANANVRLTKSCTLSLSKDRSWGGSYFYITGDNNLLLAKMHLGGSISKIERIVKQ